MRFVFFQTFFFSLVLGFLFQKVLVFLITEVWIFSKGFSFFFDVFWSFIFSKDFSKQVCFLSKGFFFSRGSVFFFNKVFFFAICFFFLKKKGVACFSKGLFLRKVFPFQRVFFSDILFSKFFVFF